MPFSAKIQIFSFTNPVMDIFLNFIWNHILSCHPLPYDWLPDYLIKPKLFLLEEGVLIVPFSWKKMIF